MQIWRAREIIMDLSEMTSRHRVIQSTCIVGGVRRDVDSDMVKKVEAGLSQCKEMMDTTILPVILNDPTIKQRIVGKGVLTKEQAKLAGGSRTNAEGEWSRPRRTDDGICCL